MDNPTDDITGRKIHVFPAKHEDAHKLNQVIQETYAPFTEEGEEILEEESYHRAIDNFPLGQYLAVEVETGRGVGLGLSMQTDVTPQNAHEFPWIELTTDGALDNNNSEGEWLYGVENSVIPGYRRRGIGGKLMRVRFELTRRMNLRGMVGGGMIASYAEVADTVPVEQYVEEVIAGKRFDMNLTKQLQAGWKPGKLIPNYYPYEPALDYGVVIYWENPDYDPSKTVNLNIKPPEYTFTIRKAKPKKVVKD